MRDKVPWTIVQRLTSAYILKSKYNKEMDDNEKYNEHATQFASARVTCIRPINLLLDWAAGKAEERLAKMKEDTEREWAVETACPLVLKVPDFQADS